MGRIPAEEHVGSGSQCCDVVVLVCSKSTTAFLFVFRFLLLMLSRVDHRPDGKVFTSSCISSEVSIISRSISPLWWDKLADHIIYSRRPILSFRLKILPKRTPTAHIYALISTRMHIIPVSDKLLSCCFRN